MANRLKGAPKRKAAKKGHKKISHKKSAAGSRKALLRSSCSPSSRTVTLPAAESISRAAILPWMK